MKKAGKLSLALPMLRSAVESGEIFLMFQPKLDLRSGTVSGVEALARWQDSRRGAICPTLFIPAAEAEGLIDWFTDWAVGCAASHWAEWNRSGIDLEMAVNISALNLRHFDFPDLVSGICSDHGMPAERLTLELTEGATQDAVPLMDTISRLRLKGMGVSLDDFGTGYGSLVQLRRLPFTELKIDRNFVLDLLTSRDSRSITRALVNLAHELGLSVTAEGVEDYETLELLTSFGCDKAQGFLIAKPMSGDMLPIWLARFNGLARMSVLPAGRLASA